MDTSEVSLTPLVALLGGACFAVVYRIPRRYFIHASLLAMTAKLSVEYLSTKFHISFATFFSAFIVGAISHLFARSTGKPAQAFLIPGVMYLVPGTSLYRTIASAMNNDFAATSILLAQAVVVTASISFALLLANWIVPSKRTL